MKNMEVRTRLNGHRFFAAFPLCAGIFASGSLGQALADNSRDWAQGKVHINLSQAGILHSPEYDTSKLLTRRYEAQLCRHYHQPGYWPDQKS